MKRLAAISLLTSMPLLLAQPAMAQDCFCGAAPTFGFESPDTTIVSAAPSVDHPAAEQIPAPRTVLWCSSQNDPRCMPMQSSDVPLLRALGSGPVGVAVDIARLRVARVGIEMSMTPTEGLPPAHGVSLSIDRPPRR